MSDLHKTILARLRQGPDSERYRAALVATVVLERPGVDHDSDVAVMARQLLGAFQREMGLNVHH